MNPRKYRNNGLYVSLMRMAINVGDDPMNENRVPKQTRKKLRKERKSIYLTCFFFFFKNKIFLIFFHSEFQIAVPRNGQKGPMLGVNHAAHGTDLR